jgi:hypothetical protein
MDNGTLAASRQWVREFIPAGQYGRGMNLIDHSFSSSSKASSDWTPRAHRDVLVFPSTD